MDTGTIQYGKYVNNIAAIKLGSKVSSRFAVEPGVTQRFVLSSFTWIILLTLSSKIWQRLWDERARNQMGR